MDFSFSWDHSMFEFSLVLIMALVAFLAWYFPSKSDALFQVLRKRYGTDQALVYRIYVQRFLGFTLFGIIPAIILFSTQPYSPAEYGLAWKWDPEILYWTLGLSLVLGYATSISTKKPDSLEMYPEIRKKDWSKSIYWWSAIGWVAYLIGYEWMFRGWLLFACERAVGVWPAIIINTVIYSLVHVPKSAREGIGAIPLGILLCIITFRTGNIVVAVVVHIVLALCNEWFSLRYHPEIGVRKSGSSS
jgi:membrane protease YdiL (CAAX protease family)